MSTENPESTQPKQKARYIPSKKEFNGKVLSYAQEELKATIDSVSHLNGREVSKRLEKYSQVDLGRTTVSSTNTFEMIALYQRAMTLSGYAVGINGRFNHLMHENLKKYQANGNIKIDGLPGRETTEKILQEMKAESKEALKAIAKERLASLGQKYACRIYVLDTTPFEYGNIEPVLTKLDAILSQKHIAKICMGQNIFLDSTYENSSNWIRIKYTDSVQSITDALSKPSVVIPRFRGYR